jgi:hypothetical protein
MLGILARMGRIATDARLRIAQVELPLHLGRVEQLFDSLDPTPFHDRDLDPRAEEYIVDWAREQRPSSALTLRVYLDVDRPEAETLVQEAVTRYFLGRAEATRRDLRELLRNGRLSLAIGVAIVAAAMFAADVTSGLRYGVLSESLVIGGWVAMWRPLEIFLYDWWPIRREARLYDRLAGLTVSVVPSGKR